MEPSEIFTWVISSVCNEPPPTELCAAWFFDDDDHRLEEWVQNRIPPGVDAMKVVDSATDISEVGASDWRAM